MKGDLSQKNTCKYDFFYKYSGKMVFPKQLHWNMNFLVLSGKLIFLFFLENMILFFRREMADNISQKIIHENMVFSAYLVKMVFLFPRNMILPFCQKSKDYIFFRKIHIKTIFPLSLKKMIFILENMVFLLTE